MTTKDITVLQLIPRNELHLSYEKDVEAIESHRTVINAKMLDLAVKQCTTKRLDIWVNEAEARELTPQMYNDIWDALLVHGKAGALDVRIVFRLPEGLQDEQFLTAGTKFHPNCSPKSTSLANFIQDEAETPYVLYDNPRQISQFMRKRVALGGTFDRMHIGHKKLLSIAMQCAQELVIVGVTSDTMLANKRNYEKIDPLHIRLERVREFMASACVRNVKYEVVVIEDPFGPTISIENLDGIVCSSETLKGALAVNVERAKRGFPPLLPILVLRSNAYVLSSTFIRDRLAL